MEKNYPQQDFRLYLRSFNIYTIQVLVTNVDGYYHLHLKDIVFESTPKSKSHPQTEMRGLLFLWDLVILKMVLQMCFHVKF